MMEKTAIHFNARRESGNIYFIMGMVRNALHKERRIQEWNDLRDKILNSGSYEEALYWINQHVDLIDDSKMYVKYRRPVKVVAFEMCKEGTPERKEAERMIGKEFSEMEPDERVTAAEYLSAFDGKWQEIQKNL